MSFSILLASTFLVSITLGYPLILHTMVTKQCFGYDLKKVPYQLYMKGYLITRQGFEQDTPLAINPLSGIPAENGFADINVMDINVQDCKLSSVENRTSSNAATQF